MSDLMPAKESPRRIVATYPYHDAQGSLLYEVVRYEPKGFSQRRPDGQGGHVWSLGDVQRVLYRLPELLAAGSETMVFLVEGEKDADRLASLGIHATTNAAGASKWRDEYTEALRNRHVVIVSDNDDAGRKHAKEVAQSLHGVSASVRVLHLPNLPAKGDVSDWLNAGGNANELMQLAKECPEWSSIDADSEELEASDSTNTGFQPFPVQLLPSPLRENVEAVANATGCDESYVALPFLVAAGASIGCTRRLQLKRSWHVVPVLWGVGIGESGSTKTPAYKAALSALSKWQQSALRKHEAETAEYSKQRHVYDKEMDAWKKNKAGAVQPDEPLAPPAERILVADATLEAMVPILRSNPRGLLLATDELASWVGQFNRYSSGGKGGDEAAWLSFYNGDDVLVDRKTGTPRTLMAPQAAVSVYGTTQPGIFNKIFTKDRRESGLAARLLVTWPPRMPKQWTEADVDPATTERTDRMFERLRSLEFVLNECGERCPVIVGMTPEAKRLWVPHYNAHNKEQAMLSGELAAAWAKLEEIPARLALILHFVRWAGGDPTLSDPALVDAQTMQAAIELAGWFKQEARRVYAALCNHGEQASDERTVAYVESCDGVVTPRQLQQNCSWLKASGAAEAACERLVTGGYGEWSTAPSTSRGGRPSRKFMLSGYTQQVDSQQQDCGALAT